MIIEGISVVYEVYILIPILLNLYSDLLNLYSDMSQYIPICANIFQ